MILTIDVGNTNIVLGLFKGKTLAREWRFPSSSYSLPKIKGKLDRIIVASVVPAIDSKLKVRLQKKYKLFPAFITAANIPKLKVWLQNKREIGADRVVDALAAYIIYGGPAIIVDFGTATTFDVVSARGEYLGGAIAPGLELSRDILKERTAKLPKVAIKAPRNVIGKNTTEAIRSGLVFGYVALVEGMIKRIKDELTPYPPLLLREGEQKGVSFKVIATGGLAKLICKQTTIIDKIDDKLTLKGLRIIGELNV